MIGKKQMEDRMGNTSIQMEELVSLLERNVQNDGMFDTVIPNHVVIRGNAPHQCQPDVIPAGIVLGCQGTKYIHLDGRRYDFIPGNFMVLFLPMVAMCEVTEASQEKPFLATGLSLDQDRLAKMLMTLDRFEPGPPTSHQADLSGLFSAPVQNSLLDAMVRLLRTLERPAASAALADGIIDEIYFHILTDGAGGALRHYLQQRGQIRQIARAVEHVHQNLDKQVSVDQLAEIVHMSSSGFHRKFKEVMHLSPLQYAKSIKLSKAQEYLSSGKSVSEAGYLVGYNSPAQFSREYKRHFGMVPSA